MPHRLQFTVMSLENPTNTYETFPQIESVAPAAESLLHVRDRATSWPGEIKENKQLEKEIALRNEAITSIDSLFVRIPKADMDITEALDSGIVTEEDVAVIYEHLTAFIESDEYNKRFILYFPFEFIPSTSWQPKSQELQVAMHEFRTTYLTQWEKLLLVNDVRANFVDGDVPEVELRKRPLERVAKAAHLLPKLVEKGLVTMPEIIDLIESNPGNTLQASIVDTLPVLVDMGFISLHEAENLLQSNYLTLPKKRTKEISPDQMTEGRLKWLNEKNKPVTMQEGLADVIDRPFEEKQPLLATEEEVLKSAVHLIESSPELSKVLYPACILFGSKVKGYGSLDADMDVALFVKPGNTQDDIDSIRASLATIIPHEQLKGKIVEFWLEEEDDELTVIDFPKPQTNIADSSWSHVLFEGAWVGNSDAIKELYSKLLTGYLYSEDKTIQGADARRIWLEEMERDTLQYRLMHKGYARLFPEQGGIHTEHSDSIDGKNMFYDSGYRRLATKLYLNKVFLPQLEK